MKFIQTSVWASISTAISLIARLVTNKVIAIYLGTNGMFLLGQLKDFLKISLAGSHAGTLNGTTKYVAELKTKQKSLAPLLSTSFKIHLVASVFICLICLIFGKQISLLIFKTVVYNRIIWLLGLSLISASIYNLILAILNGIKAIKSYVLITSLAAVVNAILLVVLVYYYNINGAFYALAIGQFNMFVIALIVVLYNRNFDLKSLTKRFSKTFAKALSKFSLMALIAPLCLVVSTIFVRQYVATEFDSNHAGSWEGMWRLSALYLMFLTTTFKFYLLPTYSELSGKALRNEVFSTWKIVLPTILIIALLVYLLRDLIITILFTEEFVLITVLIGFHLLGDVVKINTWVLGNLLIAKAKSTAFILFQLEWALVFILGTIFFTNHFGFKGVAIAYFVACCIHFTLMNIYLRKLLWTDEPVTSQN